MMYVLHTEELSGTTISRGGGGGGGDECYTLESWG